MTIVLSAQITVLLFLFSGCYFLGLNLLRIPSRRADNIFRANTVFSKPVRDRLADALVKPFIEPIANFIPISFKNQVVLEAELRQVGITLGAKEYHARAIIISLYSVVIPVVILALRLHPILLYSFATLPLVLYRHFITVHEDRLREKRHKISLLLPSFVRSILYSLSEREEDYGNGTMGQVNLVQIFGNYLQVAPEVIKYDISLLITEMQAVSVEAGIRRFGERLRMPTVTYLCDILIGLSRGQPQAQPLAILARDIDTQYRESRRAELLKRPGDMYRALIPVGLIFIGLLLYLVFSDMIASVGQFG